LKRRTLTVALAGLLALLGVVAVLAYARQANARAIKGQKAETVLAAKSTIHAGTSLATAKKDKLLTSETVPAASLSAIPVQSVTTANAHLVVSSNVPAGELLTQNMLASSAAVAANPGLVIPKNQVAVTVQMCAAEAVANYLTAGSEVTVFETYPVSPKANVQRTCETSHVAVSLSGASTVPVLHDVRVLAVTHALPSSGSTSTLSSLVDPLGASLSQDTVAVTFAVSPADAQKLIEAAQVYLIYLALQPTG
jgi:pilus assembly protein CpaB